jgi:hypothetical protein
MSGVQLNKESTPQERLEKYKKELAKLAEEENSIISEETRTEKAKKTVPTPAKSAKPKKAIVAPGPPRQLISPSKLELREARTIIGKTKRPLPRPRDKSKDPKGLVRLRIRAKLLNPDEGSAITILGFGDSLTAGTPGYDPDSGGDERSQYGFWLLESSKSEGHHHVSFVNQGLPGELSQLMQGRLERLLQQKRYDTVIILGGSNDIGWGYPVHTIFKTAELELWPARFRPLAQSSLTYK